MGFNPDGNNCYLKSAIDTVEYTYRRLRVRQNLLFADSAQRVAYDPSSSISTVPLASSTSVSSSTTATGASTSASGTSTLPTGPSTSPTQASTIVYTSVVTSGSITSTITTTSTTTPSGTASNSAAPCPTGNNTVYENSPSRAYQIACGLSYNYDNIITVNATTFTACMDACDSYIPAAPGDSGDQPCIAISWSPDDINGDQCYLHYAIYSVSYISNVDSAELVANYTAPVSSSTSSVSTSTVPTVYTLSSTSGTVVFVTTISSSASSISISSPTSSSTSTIIAPSGVSSRSSYLGTSASSGFSSSVSSSTSVVIGSSSSTSSSSMSTFSGLPSAVAMMPCPASNGSTYTTLNGRVYDIYCGSDIASNNLPASEVQSFEDCMTLCDNYVPTAPGNTYVKSNSSHVQ